MSLLKLISDAIYNNEYPRDVLGIICEYVPHKQRVFCGYDYSVAMKDDGTLHSWGYDNFGQVSVSSRGWYSVTLKDDGTLHSWGWNKDGQVSDTPESIYF